MILVGFGGSAIALTGEEIIKHKDSSCQYRGEAVVSEFISANANNPSTTFCLRDGECSLKNAKTDYLFMCAAVKGKCPSNPKDCYQSAVTNGNMVSTTATVTDEDDESLKDFATCKYSSDPRTGFFKAETGVDSGWLNTCFARVACTAKRNGEHPPSFVMCQGKAVVGTKASPKLRCPKVNECMNGRVLDGSKWMDVDLPDLRGNE